MQIIKLPDGTFEFDPTRPLGRPGGFGQVFLGKSPDGQEVAVKKLHLSAADAAHRELRIGDEFKGRSFEHIVPVIDKGEDADTGDLFVVMPKAERSLQETINESGPFAPLEVTTVLFQVVKGLLEVGELVHRDLKPDNILFHEGKWKIADFGIARFVEDATSANTLKDCLSPLYAAPEQWRFERATHATDVYSLGCIAFCLLTGRPPFTRDPQVEHQRAPVPPFECTESRLTTLINMCLRKEASSRPSLSRIRDILEGIIKKPQPANGMISSGVLSTAAAQVSTKEQEVQARKAAEEAAHKARIELAKTAYETLADNAERLWRKIHSQAPNASRERSHDPTIFTYSLGDGQLTIDYLENETLEPYLFSSSGWDVVASSKIIVSQQNLRFRWSASLWYSKMQNNLDYRWYEASYWCMRSDFNPYALDPGRDADLAASSGSHSVDFAFGPIAIDDEQEDEFHERWIWLLSKAAIGQLKQPSVMPFRWPPY